MRIALERRSSALAALRLSGRLRPGWCGRLANGLAARGIDITRGDALAVQAGIWRAEFDLRCGPEGEPTAEEVAQLLAADAGAGFTTPIELLGYSLAWSESRGGCLALEVEGRDRTGFLASLLRRLAYFALFPVELHLETSDERVRDRFWLRSGGGRPLDRTEKALAASLDALVQP